MDLSCNFAVISSGVAIERRRNPAQQAFRPGAHVGLFMGRNTIMTIHSLALTPLISLIAGILILVMPRLLNYIVALYLIVVGLLGLFPQLAG